MLTPRHIVMAARLVFVAASLGMAVLMLGPFQGLEQMFGLNDKAAHVVAFYGVALFVVAAAFAAELLQGLTGRSVSIVDFLAGSAGVLAAWAPGRIEQIRQAFRRSPDLTFAEIARADRRLRRRRTAVGRPGPSLVRTALD